MLRRVGAVTLGLLATLSGLVFVDLLIAKFTVLLGPPLIGLLIFGSSAVCCGVGAQRLWRRSVREPLESSRLLVLAALAVGVCSGLTFTDLSVQLLVALIGAAMLVWLGAELGLSVVAMAAGFVVGVVALRVVHGSSIGHLGLVVLLIRTPITVLVATIGGTLGQLASPRRGSRVAP